MDKLHTLVNRNRYPCNKPAPRKLDKNDLEQPNSRHIFQPKLAILMQVEIKTNNTDKFRKFTFIDNFIKLTQDQFLLSNIFGEI